MLHESLNELHHQARRCDRQATLAGVAAEAQELLRNAIDHSAPPAELSQWLAGVVTGLLHSPAAREMTGGAQMIVSGPFGRGNGLPTSPIYWFTVTDDATGLQTVKTGNTTLAGIFTDTGYTVGDQSDGYGPADRTTWKARITSSVSARDGKTMGWFVDAGNWMAPLVMELDKTGAPLFEQVLATRPPMLKKTAGLPARDSVVDIRGHLITPVADLARWAAFSAGSGVTPTLDRLSAAQAAGVLTADETDYLRQAWAAALSLVFERWFEGLDDGPQDYQMVPQVQRSIYGAACRSLSEVIASVQTRLDSR
ncbi:putative nucleotidyltransferase substrate binding domain-containing protein [Corynebacterium mendelii]|uniref:Nucleotidyltransferase n=1 Tax=Corynebacterium mendelii TaxID=2765362 RepID=A0A939E3D8_9CORY|nr:putative nucleotidyltransferase substrate binding domain-containing protein [Corynebacterium mendelii]MBN9644702.1 nucleotidyltransferase [Corynebacterium mendelii]